MIEIPGYKLNEELLQAYHSFLYRGTRKSDNKPVLIETFLTEFDTPIQGAQFRLEFSIIKNHKSEGFINAYDTQNFRDGLALILEDFPGEPLYRGVLRLQDIGLLTVESNVLLGELLLAVERVVGVLVELVLVEEVVGLSAELVDEGFDGCVD